MDLAILFSAACGLFGAGCELPVPAVEYVTQAWLQAHACPSGRCGRGVFWGWYRDDGTVYLWADAPHGPEFDAVVVHELVHMLQHLTGAPAGYCERERQAYSIADRYLIHHRGVMPGRHPLC